MEHIADPLYSNQGGLLKIAREQMGKTDQGPGSEQSHAGSGRPAGSDDHNSAVEQFPVGIDGKGPVPIHSSNTDPALGKSNRGVGRE
jgi:hypothetical protein